MVMVQPSYMNGIPNGRLCPSFGQWRFCLWVALTLSTIGNARQMGATHPTSEKPLGLLAKGSRNTPRQQPQLYLNTVKISTTHYHPSLILAL